MEICFLKKCWKYYLLLCAHITNSFFLLHFYPASETQCTTKKKIQTHPTLELNLNNELYSKKN